MPQCPTGVIGPHYGDRPDWLGETPRLIRGYGTGEIPIFTASLIRILAADFSDVPCLTGRMKVTGNFGWMSEYQCTARNWTEELNVCLTRVGSNCWLRYSEKTSGLLLIVRRYSSIIWLLKWIAHLMVFAFALLHEVTKMHVFHTVL